MYISNIRYSIFKSPEWAFAQAAVFHHQLSQHARYHGLAMDALEIVCTLVSWTLLWFGRGCTRSTRNTDVIMAAMDAFEIVCTRPMAVIMVPPWMLWSEKARALKDIIPIYICIHTHTNYGNLI